MRVTLRVEPIDRFVRECQQLMQTNLYFAFPDGVLHYDCARCTALCCRGHGIAAHDRELVQLLRKAPALAGWSSMRNRKLVYFHNGAGRCVFLEQDDRCRVERELGRPNKPSMCKAFPFNHVQTLGATCLVAPNFLCPLTLESASSANAGAHARLAEALRQDGWLDQNFPEVILHPSDSPASFLESEGAFRDACARALVGGDLERVCADDAPAASDPLEAAAALLLTEPEAAQPAAGEQLEPMFLALAPVWSLEFSQLSRALRRRALLLARWHLGRALSLASRPISLQVVHGLFSTHTGIYDLLAQGDAPMPSGLLTDSGDGSTLLAAAVIDQMARSGASVFEALREGCEGLSQVDRQTLISSLGAMQRKRTRKPQA